MAINNEKGSRNPKPMSAIQVLQKLAKDPNWKLPEWAEREFKRMQLQEKAARIPGPNARFLPFRNKQAELHEK